MNDKKFDSLAKKALSTEEIEFMNKAEEQNVFEMVSGIYKGKNKWLSIYIAIIMLISFGFTIYCTVQFFETEVIKEMLIWGAGGFFGLLMTTALKIWLWMQMNNNVMLREMKRIELQLTILTENVQ